LELKQIIEEAFLEDLPDGDLTTDNLGVIPFKGVAQLVAKEDLILAGSEIFAAAIHFLDPEVEIQWRFTEGQLVLERQTIATLRGDLLKILKAERVALNFLGHLSGIATLTRCFVEKMARTECIILDTRKTTPLLRVFEKAAVRAGGGTNHRANLSDVVMIKDNHIRATGSIEQAIKNIRNNYTGPVFVECTTLDEVDTAVALRVERIMLDNMTIEMMKAAREKIPVTIEVEATGNMTLERVAEVAQLGVDFISVGAVTHSAPNADISLSFDWKNRGTP
jgi:nicotinate-nucleotide pyrophosphorylase (carboxylating)